MKQFPEPCLLSGFFGCHCRAMSWIKLWGRAGGVPPVAGGLFQIHAGIYNYIQVHTTTCYIFAIVEYIYIYTICV